MGRALSSMCCDFYYGVTSFPLLVFCPIVPTMINIITLFLFVLVFEHFSPFLVVWLAGLTWVPFLRGWNLSSMYSWSIGVI